MSTKDMQELTSYWESWSKHKSLDARDNLVMAYMSLVDYVADRIAINLPPSVQKDDLKSLGYMGLLESVERFDFSRGLKFETFAMWRIKGSILDGLRKADWVPRSIRKKSKDLEIAFQTLQSSQKEEVTDEQVAEFLNISMNEYQQMVMDVQIATVISIDETVGEEGSSFRDIIPDMNNPTPEDELNASELAAVLAESINKLPDKERIVVSLYYYEELTLTEIAKIMSVSTSRISQLHSKAMLRLRGYLSRQKKELL